MVLVSLYMSDDYCQSPSDIYKELQFSKTNITHIIDKLEKKNIAKRINNKNDRRSKSICLTPDGVTCSKTNKHSKCNAKENLERAIRWWNENIWTRQQKIIIKP